MVWLYVYGHWPSEQIDHKNGIRDDNSFQNLREASNAQNAQNQRRPRRNNKTGLLGVSPSFGKFKAQIVILGPYAKATVLGVALRSRRAAWDAAARKMAKP